MTIKRMEPVKLVDGLGALLGILYIPKDAFDKLLEKHEVRIMVCDRMRIPVRDYYMLSPDETAYVHTIYLSRSSSTWQRAGCVLLHGMKPQELNKYDGFCFIGASAGVS